MDNVQALSCVLRVGRAKAKADYSAILFNDPDTGAIKRGTTNVSRYQRSPGKVKKKTIVIPCGGSGAYVVTGPCGSPARTRWASGTSWPLS